MTNLPGYGFFSVAWRYPRAGLTARQPADAPPQGCRVVLRPTSIRAVMWGVVRLTGTGCRSVKPRNRPFLCLTAQIGLIKNPVTAGTSCPAFPPFQPGVKEAAHDYRAPQTRRPSKRRQFMKAKRQTFDVRRRISAFGLAGLPQPSPKGEGLFSPVPRRGRQKG